jgi:hypothetical protein
MGSDVELILYLRQYLAGTAEVQFGVFGLVTAFSSCTTPEVRPGTSTTISAGQRLVPRTCTPLIGGSGPLRLYPH